MYTRAIAIAIYGNCIGGKSMISRFAYKLIFSGLISLLIFLHTQPIFAYIYFRHGLASNFLFIDNNVIFVQVTGSLTVLDVASGKVLLRKSPKENFEYVRSLTQYPHGILLLEMGRAILLDQKSFDPIWTINDCWVASIDSEWIISHNDNNTVQCHDLKTGKMTWEAPLAEGHKFIVAAKGRALVATRNFNSEKYIITIYDLENGRELLRKSEPLDIKWDTIYFDGEFIYILSFDETRIGRSNSDCLIKLDLGGEIVTTIQLISNEVIPAYKWDSGRFQEFIFKDKYFQQDGAVRDASPDELALANEGKDQGSFYSTPSSRQFMVKAKDSSGEEATLLKMELGDDSWVIYPSYITEKNMYFGYGREYKGKLFIGSNLGSVECIDIATGNSLWIYIFPANNILVACSYPYGMPAHLETQSYIYWKLVKDLTKIAGGSLLVPKNYDISKNKWSDLKNSIKYQGRIIVDPSPDNPFKGLWKYRAWLAFYSFMPLMGIALFIWRRCKKMRQTDQVTPVSSFRQSLRRFLITIYYLILTIFPTLGLWWYGGVNYVWSLGFKIFIAVVILYAVYNMIRLCFQRRWIFSVPLLILLLYWIIIIKDLWWYT
jgi:outer membrane protein assembly factor BamB